MSAPTFFDLFAGAGGLSLGLMNAGWTPLGALDIWDEAVETYRSNFRDHPAWVRDISETTAKWVLDSAGTRPDWLVGGPPCQGFSTVGRRKREDPRNRLIYEYFRLVEELRPRGVLVENVLGLRDMDFVGEITRLFRSVGYRTTPLVVSAADFGVPQLRRRVLFVATLEDSFFLAPDPTHRDQHVSVWDAIGDLPPLEPGETATEYVRPPETEFQKRARKGSDSVHGHVASRHPDYLVRAISHIPDGGNRRAIPDHLQPKSGFHNSYSRLDSSQPAVAVTQNMGKPSGTRCIHPFQHRGLTAREGARLQSFPDSFHFLGGITSQRLQVANAVPPLLAEALGRSLASDTAWSEDVKELAESWAAEQMPLPPEELAAIG